jgi:uncharacterized membrane protein HdeD (DUF308 family)
MTTATSEGAFSPQKRALPWWVTLIQGIALVILGILLLSNPARTTVIVVQVLGLYWLVSGIMSLVGIFIDHSAWGWKLFSGILGIIAGIVVLNHPLWSPVIIGATLIIVLGIQAIISGILGVILGIQGGGWGTLILGVVGIIIGIILLANVWVSAFSLPWVLGIFGLIGGVMAIVAAFRQRGSV